jgi:hypothetical protein
MATRAVGTFEVKMVPQESVDDSTVARMTLDKQFQGDLEATSKGQMLAFMTGVKGSAGYVAMERVVGTLHGRAGSFTLQHGGTMTRGVPELSVTVVPDSGLDELAGLAGRMTIVVDASGHSYVFDYAIEPAG